MASHSVILIVFAVYRNYLTKDFKMFNRMLALLLISLIFTNFAESLPAIVGTSRQLLLAAPDRIPVYIRSGDTPLDDISHDLAEAFNFYAQKNNRITFGRFLKDKPDNDAPVKSELRENTMLSETAKFPLDLDIDDDKDTNNPVNDPQISKDKDSKPHTNIQRIPRP